MFLTMPRSAQDTGIIMVFAIILGVSVPIQSMKVEEKECVKN